MDAKSRDNRRVVWKLLIATVAMFGFGFALIPMYNTLCKVVGLNGKTERLSVAAAKAEGEDKTRTVTVEFMARLGAGLPWEFKPMVDKMTVHPGEIASVKYYVRNLSNQTIVARAIDSVSPQEAAVHFKKLQCFCFSNQTLKPHEVKELPVRYIVQRDLPDDLDTMTLAYTFYRQKS